ncbi:Uncharacterised protein [Mycobacteroides abscessus subsp. abscessus]|nr:Uncharacterised protein [Mycobacteroides abscessus subsp. abscessus]
MAAIFYLYEAAQSIRPAAFYSLLGGTALLAAFTMIFLRPSVIAVTLAIAALSVGYAACIGLNSARWLLRMKGQQGQKKGQELHVISMILSDIS